MLGRKTNIVRHLRKRPTLYERVYYAGFYFAAQNLTRVAYKRMEQLMCI